MAEPQDNTCYTQYQDIDAVCNQWQNGSAWTAVKGVLSGSMNMLGIGNIFGAATGDSDYMSVSSKMLKCWSDHFNYVATTMQAEVDKLKWQVNDDRFRLVNSVIEKYHTSDQLLIQTMKNDVTHNTFLIYVLFAFVSILIWDRLSS